MSEKRIPRGKIYPQTIGIIVRNGGEIRLEEIILRNVQAEKPYLNTGAKKIFFSSGEYIYYNENGIWNDVNKLDEIMYDFNHPMTALLDI